MSSFETYGPMSTCPSPEESIFDVYSRSQSSEITSGSHKWHLIYPSPVGVLHNKSLDRQQGKVYRRKRLLIDCLTLFRGL